MRVALVTSWGTCGIAEHSTQLREHVQTADGGISICIDPAWLDPEALLPDYRSYDLVHLNYHRGLHSRWTPEHVRLINDSRVPVVVTFHDTYEQQPDTLPWDLLATCDAMVVHEPCDLSEALPNEKVRYWRQAVPAIEYRGLLQLEQPRAFANRGWYPTLGTVGFDFPWKNYDLLADITGELGWNLRIVGQVDDSRREALRGKNVHTHFDGYVGTELAVSILSGCDATAFLYTCGNSGTSGAIRLGMAAGKPLFAADGCRQFRDLQLASDGWPIRWIAPTVEGLGSALTCLTARSGGPQGYNLGLIGLAHQESWKRQGAQYAALYRDAVATAVRP